MCWKCRLIKKVYKRNGWNNLLKEKEECNILELNWVIIDEIIYVISKPFRFLKGLIYFKYHEKEQQ